LSEQIFSPPSSQDDFANRPVDKTIKTIWKIVLRQIQQDDFANRPVDKTTKTIWKIVLRQIQQELRSCMIFNR